MRAGDYSRAPRWHSGKRRQGLFRLSGDQQEFTMRIMVIDDSEDGRDVTEAMLLTAGYEHVSAAESAAEAYRLLGIGEPAAEPVAIDLILLDIVMPDVDGIEAC